MEPLSLTDVAACVEGRVVAADGDVQVRRVVIDSRQARTGDLFVCLRGTRTDGHAFARAAIGQGAAAALCQEPVEADVPRIEVRDTLRSLRVLAQSVRAAAREDGDPLVIAVTGTNGKTSTKDLIAAAFSTGREVVRSHLSFNNAVGVPLTLLEIADDTEVVVVEVGTNAPGEIADLASMVEPEIGVITNVGQGHLSGLVDLDGVREEKGSLMDALVGRRVAVLNRDDPSFEILSARAQGEVVSYGLHEGADVRGQDVRCLATGTHFRLADGTEVHLPHLGRHAASNALAALACVQVAGADLSEAVAGLAQVPPPPGRLQLRRRDGLMVLDDTYNANPASVASALETLRDVARGSRRVAVLGDMLELGPASSSLHREAGRLAAEGGVGLLVAVGQAAEDLAAGAREGGLDPSAVIACGERRAAARVLGERLQVGDVVLVKGSRGMALEGLVRQLESQAAAQP